MRNPDHSAIKARVETFNLVKDLVVKLVKGGILEAQIAVVTGNTSKDRRQEIADAMNAGTIRVVIGLTKTLGIGVNMQTHLRALHHLDTPWMPGELEQRNGRGHRQGNQWNTLFEYRYITDRVDGRRWQVLAVKDRFIKQFLKADDDTRIIDGDAVGEEDDSDILSSLAEAAGDPRILLRQKYKAEVDKLDHRDYMHTQSQGDSRRRANQLQGQIARLQRAAKKLTTDIARALVLRGQPFAITIDGKTYSERAEADAAIKTFVEHLEPDDFYKTFGELGDFILRLKWPAVNRPLDVIAVGVSGQEYGIKASVASIESVLRHLPGHLDTMQKDVADKQGSLPRLLAAGEAPFPRAADLAKKR